MRDSPSQSYFHYLLWEDYRNGMYGNTTRQDLVGPVAELLQTPDLFIQILRDVAEQWPYATAQNLSNIYRNHQPWCGRAAACLEHGATLHETNQAWQTLTHREQLEANKVADLFTYQWRSDNMPGQMVFPI